MAQQQALSQDLEAALWGDACLAAQVFAHFIHSGAYGKATLRLKGYAGPVRDLWLAYLKSLLPPETHTHQVPVNITAERLLGGLDLGLTLAAGKAVEMRGVLTEAHQNLLFLPMAHLAEATTVSLIAAAMDSGNVRLERDGMSKLEDACFAFLCFDEAGDDDEPVSSVLADRIMLHVDLRAVSLRTARQPMQPAKTGKVDVSISDDMRSQLCALAASFGLLSMRPAFQLIQLAKAICALSNDDEFTEQHVAAAVRLCLVHRAKQMPPPPPEEAENQENPPPPEPDTEDPPPNPSQDTQLPDDMECDSTEALLPPNLLAYLEAVSQRQSMRAPTGRRGAKTLGRQRGRPLTSRKGVLSAGKRLDLIATLRAAAPFQKSRQSARGNTAQVKVRKSDIHIRRYQERTETSTIFIVDASGSTALNRLGEAKGAVEILLAESYARRDYVSLICFRGRDAQVLLPPTRALVRAKRSLASLPGGGGTPLASGMRAALALAQEERGRGRDPALIFMTDGSANVGLDGAGGRKQAAEDATSMAKKIGGAGLPALIIDIARQPKPQAKQLAGLMAATYLPMPFANAQMLSKAVQAAQ